MIQKIKVESIFDFESVNSLQNGLFFEINQYLEEVLAYYGITNETYEESILSTFLSEERRTLDIDYFIENSSEKYLSKYALFELKRRNNNLDNVVEDFAENIAVKFGYKWWKICEAFTKDYKPLENYDMEETRTPNLTENLTRNQSTEIHQETESGIYGFNSQYSNPTATGSGDTGGSKIGNETSDVKTNTGTEKLTRHGNIGVTTSQQMLESEIKLRQYNFIEGLFKDIDSILCLKIY